MQALSSNRIGRRPLKAEKFGSSPARAIDPFV